MCKSESADILHKTLYSIFCHVTWRDFGQLRSCIGLYTHGRISTKVCTIISTLFEIVTVRPGSYFTRWQCPATALWISNLSRGPWPGTVARCILLVPASADSLIKFTRRHIESRLFLSAVLNSTNATCCTTLLGCD